MKYLFQFIIVASAYLVLFSNSGFSFIDEPSDSSKIFYLGQIVIFGEESGTLSPFQQNIIRQSDLENRHSLDASHALRLLPGLSISNVGGRNESMVYIRGYDLRQVPVFIDGIPEYVPYDGYVDLARFTTFDISEISVSKGFSSVLFGANAMGGAINLVSRKPSAQLDYDFSSGVMNSGGYDYSLNLGTKQSLYYLMGNVSKLNQNSFKLSKSFTATTTENGGERDNSYRRDAKYNFKLGVTPNETNEYSFSYMNQRGEKGNPVYTGSNPSGTVRYWRWPDWDKISQYFISQTMFGEKESANNVLIKTRFFHDKFKNTLKGYDNSTYSTQTKKSSFTSVYDDDTWGAVLEAKTKYFQQHQLTLALHYKHDIHREHNLGEPVRMVRDAIISTGVEDMYRVLENLSFIGGISYDLRKSLQAKDDNSKTGVMSDFPKDDTHAWNIQFGGIYDLSSTRQISFSLARKTRFATMKDRYSYKLGTAIPNPYLIPENAINYDVAYNEKVNGIGSYKVSAFFNDIHNVIMQVSNVQGTFSQMQNLGKANYYGAETEIEAQPASFIKTGANYTYLKRKNISNSDVKFLDTPENKVDVYVSINPISTLEILGDMEYNSQRYSTSDGIYKAGDYAVFNLKVSVNLFKHFDLDAGIENLFDRNYCLMEGYPEAGKTGYMNIRLRN
jgi:iron complex outermembrane receptor protein